MADDDQPSDGLSPPPPNCPNAGICQEIEAVQLKTDTYAKDQKILLRWLGGVLASAAFAWGIWITVQVFAMQTAAAVAASEAKAIQCQLARIEAQLTEIQRDLRQHKP